MDLQEKEMLDFLPQQYPFVMIDRVLEFKKNESLTAIKNITGNEWFYEAEGSASRPFPETMIIESAAQTASALYYLSQETVRDTLAVGKVLAEFSDQAYVGDTLIISTQSFKSLGNSGMVHLSVKVEETEIANVEIIYGVLTV